MQMLDNTKVDFQKKKTLNFRYESYLVDSFLQSLKNDNEGSFFSTAGCQIKQIDLKIKFFCHLICEFCVDKQHNLWLRYKLRLKKKFFCKMP